MRDLFAILSLNEAPESGDPHVGKNGFEVRDVEGISQFSYAAKCDQNLHHDSTY
jgi:hypothetical protein